MLCYFTKCLPGTGEIQRIHETQGGGSSSTAGSQVTHEVTPELGVLVDTTQENLDTSMVDR